MNGGMGGASAPPILLEVSMARPRKVVEGKVNIRILADGVFVADDVRKDKGDIVTVVAEIADILIKSGKAGRV